MDNNNISTSTVPTTDGRLAKSALSSYLFNNTTNIWSVDKLHFEEHTEYAKAIKDCRFFFRKEPIVYSVISKMVDFALNDLVIKSDGKLNKTEEQIFDALRDDLIAFLRKAAFEYLLTGLVVPEITLTRLNKKQLRQKGIQRITHLLYPTDMWLRDSKDIKIKKPFITSSESYFLIIPEEAIHFIMTKGEYPDGGRDVKLYEEILRRYPEFVSTIRRGETEILLDNPLIIKSTVLGDSQYPIPYMYVGLESYKHKRNIRRMDYAIAARVISAILHVKVGSDDFPLTQDQEDILTDLENKFHWRESLDRDGVERIFTLFTNHTVEIDWVFPEIEALLNNDKYDAVNEDIMMALGFPRILITGETERSFASDPEIATLSPLNTLNVMRKQLLPIARLVFTEMKDNNSVINNTPIVEFKPINLMTLKILYEGLAKLYEGGNLSRQAYTEAYGYNFKAEAVKISEEQKEIKELGLPEFAPQPHSNDPNKPNGGGNGKNPPFNAEPQNRVKE